MKEINYFAGIAVGCCLLAACTQEERIERLAEGTEVRFTASADAPAVKATAGSDTELLNTGAHVTVHAWKGGLSGSNAPAYTNTYTFQTGNGGELKEVTEGDKMQVLVGDGYRFYALSTNSAKDVPGLTDTYNHTTVLENGVDYLAAVSKEMDIKSAVPQTIPLIFKHLATRVILKVSPAAVNGYTAVGGLTVGIANTDPAGSYIDLSATAGDPLASTPAPKIFWPAAGEGGDPVAGGVPLTSNEQLVTATKGTDGLTFTVSFILLPVSAISQGIPLTLNFTGLNFGSKASNKSYTARLMPKDLAGTMALQGGYTYTFETTITQYSTTFGLPKIAPWLVDGVEMDEVVELDPIPETTPTTNTGL